jgi:large subunit ribosomal protein L25
MSDIVFEVSRRDVVGKQVRHLRREGKLPGVVYGKGIKPFPIAMDTRESSRVMRKITSSTVVKLNIDGKTHKALVRDLQYDALTGVLVHVDFQLVQDDEMVKTRVLIKLIGTCQAVTRFEAKLETDTTMLDVQALPDDLPPILEVDIAPLKRIGQAIHVRDLKLSKNLRILTGQDATLVVATNPRREMVIGDEFDEEDIEGEIDGEEEVETEE